MDPFRLCLGLGPVAVYLCLLGTISLSRRAVLVSGVRDAATLALAVSGLVVHRADGTVLSLRGGSEVRPARLASPAGALRDVRHPLAVGVAAAAGDLQRLGGQAASHPGRRGRFARRRGAVGGREPGTARTGRAVVRRRLCGASRGIVDRRRRPAEPVRLAAVGGGVGTALCARKSPAIRAAWSSCWPACCASRSSSGPLPTIRRRSPARCWTLSSRCRGWWDCREMTKHE